VVNCCLDSFPKWPLSVVKMPVTFFYFRLERKTQNDLSLVMKVQSTYIPHTVQWAEHSRADEHKSHHTFREGIGELCSVTEQSVNMS
jgi:hypothetical protein